VVQPDILFFSFWTPCSLFLTLPQRVEPVPLPSDPPQCTACRRRTLQVGQLFPPFSCFSFLASRFDRVLRNFPYFRVKKFRLVFLKGSLNPSLLSFPRPFRLWGLPFPCQSKYFYLEKHPRKERRFFFGMLCKVIGLILRNCLVRPPPLTTHPCFPFFMNFPTTLIFFPLGICPFQVSPLFRL